MDTNALSILNQQLQRASENRRQLKKLEQTYQNLWSRLGEEESRADELQKKLQKEYRDVDQLQNGSIASLFYSILGTKEQQIQKERQEYLAAQLSFDASVVQVENIKHDLTETQQKLDALGGSEQEYLDALKAKESALLSLNDGRSRQLETNFEESSRLEEESKQLIEAIDAGNKVIRELDPMIEALMDARDWGNWDLIGGGLLVTAAKHAKMDKARNALYRVQHRLYYFNQELADVSNSGMLFQLDGFTRFADYFFDGLIVDWIVQSGINKSLSKTRELYRMVLETIHDLKAKREACSNKSYLLRQEREDLINSL
jgi:hypothetical protein